MIELSVEPFVCDVQYCQRPGRVILGTTRGPVVSCGSHILTLKRNCQASTLVEPYSQSKPSEVEQSDAQEESGPGA